MKSAELAVLEQLKTAKLTTPDLGNRFGLHISLLLPNDNKLRSLTPGKSSESSNKQSAKDRNDKPTRVKSTPRRQDQVKKKLITTQNRALTHVPSAAEMLHKETLDKLRLSRRSQLESFFKQLHSAVTVSQVVTDKQLKKASKLIAKVKSGSIQDFAGSLLVVAVEFLLEISKLKPNARLTLPQLTRLSQLASMTTSEGELDQTGNALPKAKEFTEAQAELAEAETDLRRAVSNLSIKYISVRATQELKDLRHLTYDSGCVLSALLTLFAEIDSHISVLPSFKLVESQLIENYQSYFSQPGSVINTLRNFEQLVKERKVSAEAVKRAKDYLGKTLGSDGQSTDFLKQFLQTAFRYFATVNKLPPPVPAEHKPQKPQIDRQKRQRIVRDVYSPTRTRSSRDLDLEPIEYAELSKEFHEFIKVKLQHFRASEAFSTKAQAISLAIANRKDWRQQFESLYSVSDRSAELFEDIRFRSEVLVCAEFIEVRQTSPKKIPISWNTQLAAQERERIEKTRSSVLKAAR
jgi:hypothetical protein